MKIHRVKEGKIIIINERKEKKKKKREKHRKNGHFFVGGFKTILMQKLELNTKKITYTHTQNVYTHICNKTVCTK